MLPHTPKDGHSTQHTRSSCGGRCPDKPSRTGPSLTSHFSSPSLSNATLEPATPLECGANRYRWAPEVLGSGYTPTSDPVPNNSLVVERKVKGLLNKLTMEKFDKLSDQILTWANKSEEEKDGATLISVIKLIFEKATDEGAWSKMYAHLCWKMTEQISPNVQDDSIKNSRGQPIVAPVLTPCLTPPQRLPQSCCRRPVAADVPITEGGCRPACTTESVLTDIDTRRFSIGRPHLRTRIVMFTNVCRQTTVS